MAKSKAKSTSALPAWLSSKSLLMVEVVLVVGLLREVLEDLVLKSLDVPPAMAVVFGMIVVAGTFGGLLVFFERSLKKWLRKAQITATRRTIIPEFLLHLGLISALFLFYCWLWDDETGALNGIRELFDTLMDAARRRLGSD